jgi:hypothetical protein
MLLAELSVFKMSIQFLANFMGNRFITFEFLFYFFKNGLIVEYFLLMMTTTCFHPTGQNIFVKFGDII